MLLTASTDDSRSELYSSIFNRRSQLSLALLLSFVKHTFRNILCSFYLSYYYQTTPEYSYERVIILFILQILAGSQIRNAIVFSRLSTDTRHADRHIYHYSSYVFYSAAIQYILLCTSISVHLFVPLFSRHTQCVLCKAEFNRSHQS